MIDSVATIFAGGKSSRMGQDKALIPFGDFSTLSEYQYNRLSKIFKRVYISAKSNKFNFNADIIKDNYKTSSPLVALISIFENLDIDEVFILSVDAPFISKEIIERLYREADPYSNIIVASSKNGLEPLCGIYRRDILDLAKEFLKADNHKLTSLIKSSNHQIVKFNLTKEFINLNREEDYKRAISTLI